MPPSRSNRGSKNANGPGVVNIMSFYQPIPRPPPSATQTSNTSQQQVRPSTPSLPSSSPPLPSSPLGLPHTPPKPIRAEIGASDDEGSDGGYSDESLEDLSCLLGKSKPAVPTPQKSHHNTFATPRAKRTAVEFHSSPLAIMPRHKFDLKALAKDAKCDDDTTEIFLKVKEAVSAAKQKKATPLTGSTTGDTIAGIVREKGGQDQDAQKVLRAVQRSEQSQSQMRYLFFDETCKPVSSPKAPTLANTSPWILLTKGSARIREQHLTSGVPQTILRKNGGLPDALFEWILESLCVQQSIVVRQEYCNMIASCPEQIDRLLTGECIKQLFMLLGAKDLDHPKLEISVSNIDHEPYVDRDWSCLQSFVSLLGIIAGQLSIQAAMCATQILVQLALDRFLICNAEMLSIFERAVQELTAAIPSPSWDTFCFDTNAILSGIKSRNIKATALLCIPISTKRTHDLRRRIAVSTLFQDDSLARHNAADAVTIPSIIECLKGEDFAIKISTDFSELRASIILLDIAIDDASTIQFNDREDEKKFNEGVDDLAGRLRDIWRKINDAGMRLARTEAKSVVEWVQQRLLHSVRTRKKARKNVFDIPGEEDPFLPRQRDYMRKFLQKKPKLPAAEGVKVEGGDKADGVDEVIEVDDAAKAGNVKESDVNKRRYSFEIDEHTIVVAGG